MSAKAKTAPQNDNDGCPVCLNDEVPLTHYDNKIKLKICDECWTKSHQKPLPLDEYDLQPDERTKEQVAEILQCTTRNVEILKKAGKIPAQKLRRRVDGTVRSQLIFKVSDIENYKKEIDAPKEIPFVVKTNAAEQNEIRNSSPELAFDFMEKMNNFAQMMQPKKSMLTELTKKIFIGIDELAQVSGIAKSRLEIAIKEAEQKEVLRHFTGERGKSVYRCDELDLLIENLPPTPKQLPPKKTEG